MNSHRFNVFWNFGEAENRHLRLFLMLDFLGWSGENDEEWSSGTDKSDCEKTSITVTKQRFHSLRKYTFDTLDIFQHSTFKYISRTKLQNSRTF